MKCQLVAPMLLILAGCASAPQSTESVAQNAKKTDAEKGLVCTWEVPVGSSIKQKVCRNEAEIAAGSQVDPALYETRGNPGNNGL